MKKESSKLDQVRRIAIWALISFVAIVAVNDFEGIVAGCLDALK